MLNPRTDARRLDNVPFIPRRFAASDGVVPKVIHQVVLGGLDTIHDPQRWRQSWWDDFCKSHPGFQYRTWSKEQLQGRQWYCANLYDAFFTEGFEGNFVEGNGGVLGAVKGSPECFQKLMELYEKGTVPPMAQPGPDGPRVLQMGFRDGMVLKARYPNRSRYLGAQQVVAFTGAGDQRLELATLGFSYECQVPCFSCKGVAAMREAVSDMGFLDQLGVQGWDAVLLGVEWGTGQEEVVIFPVAPGGRPRNCKIAGMVANLAAPQNGTALRRALQQGITEDGFDPSALFEAAGQLKLQFLAEKYAGCTMEEARIFRSMPLVHRAFKQLADHEPPMHFEQHELHGNLMKGFLHGSLRFEMILEPNGGIMFRCWNEDNSTNSEAGCCEKCTLTIRFVRRSRTRPYPEAWNWTGQTDSTLEISAEMMPYAMSSARPDRSRERRQTNLVNQSPSTSSSSSTFTGFVRNVNTFMHTDDDFPRRSDTTATSSTDMAISIANSSGRVVASTASVGGAEFQEASGGTAALNTQVRAHADGTCQPCVYQASKAGCHKGDQCAFCHLPHAADPRSVTRGVRKHTRDSIKERVLRLLRPPVDRDAVHEDLQAEAARHPFGRKLVIKFLDDPPEEHQNTSYQELRFQL
eukprot:symbB.v1.2.006359.t1/scaffold371.1/size308833/6